MELRRLIIITYISNIGETITGMSIRGGWIRPCLHFAMAMSCLPTPMTASTHILTVHRNKSVMPSNTCVNPGENSTCGECRKAEDMSKGSRGAEGHGGARV